MDERYKAWLDTLALNEQDIDILLNLPGSGMAQEVTTLLLMTHICRLACEVRALTEAIKEMDEEGECSEHANFQVIQ
jgi:hypothetical protein